MITFESVPIYSFYFFSPGSKLEVSSEILEKMLSSFKDTDLLPTTRAEFIFEPQLGQQPQMRTQQQIHLISKKNDWSIEFDIDRINFSKNNTNGEYSKSASIFMEEVVDFSKRLESISTLHGHRLSYVTKGILPSMPSAKLDEICIKLFNLPRFYVDNPPVEWSTKNVARSSFSIGNRDEIINVITDINRIQGLLQGKDGIKPFDRIEISFDINTFQNDTSKRFSVNEIEPFLKNSILLSDQLLDDISESII